MSPCSSRECFARIQGHNVVSFYCLCTVNKIIDLLLLLFRFAFAAVGSCWLFYACCLQSMMHLIINTLRKTYVANFHPLLLSPLVHLRARGPFPFSTQSSRRDSFSAFQLLFRSIFCCASLMLSLKLCKGLLHKSVFRFFPSPLKGKCIRAVLNNNLSLSFFWWIFTSFADCKAAE